MCIKIINQYLRENSWTMDITSEHSVLCQVLLGVKTWIVFSSYRFFFFVDPDFLYADRPRSARIKWVSIINAIYHNTQLCDWIRSPSLFRETWTIVLLKIRCWLLFYHVEISPHLLLGGIKNSLLVLVLWL